MRDLTQFLGWSGGGATSCDHKERERSVRNVDEESGSGAGGDEEGEAVAGKSLERCSFVEAITSDNVWEFVKSKTGYGVELVSYMCIALGVGKISVDLERHFELFDLRNIEQ